MIFIRRKITGEAHDLVERCPAFQRGLEGKLRAAGPGSAICPGWGCPPGLGPQALGDPSVLSS